MAQVVWEIAEPVAAERGLEVVDVEFRSENGRAVVRVFADRESGVTLDELAGFSRELGDVIEVRDVLKMAYTLEASSPGVNRRLARAEHYPRFIGKRIRVHAVTAIDGRQNFLGTLMAATDREIVLQTEEGTEVRIPFTAVARANYEHDFGGRRPDRPARRGGGSPRGSAPRRT
jgi:ribosome maturation factor RimP